MKDQAIEPDEIIVEKGRFSKKEDVSHVNPWVRFISRFFDYSLFFMILLPLKKVISEQFIPYEFFLWIPVEAFLLYTLGTTPGKFFLKTRLKFGKKGKLDFMTALKRSFSVWFRGLGMGIPVINFLCLLVAFNRLKVFKITTWDHDDQVTVTHLPIKNWRIYVAVFVALTGVLYYYSEKTPEIVHAKKLRLRSINEHPLREFESTQSHFPT